MFFHPLLILLISVETVRALKAYRGRMQCTALYLYVLVYMGDGGESEILIFVQRLAASEKETTREDGKIEYIVCRVYSRGKQIITYEDTIILCTRT